MSQKKLSSASVVIGTLRVKVQFKDSDRECILTITCGPRNDEKTRLWGHANNIGTDQPANPLRLISTAVIRFLED